MTNDELKALVFRELKKIAPETDPDQIDPDLDMREQIDLDSMDILNLMIAIHAATGVEIPEADYPKLSTLATCISYLTSHGA